MAGSFQPDPSPLSQAEVHVWYTVPEQIVDPPLLNRYAGLLSLGERQQHRRFVFEADRHRYLVSRALVRTVLSRYVEVPPTAWTFRLNAYGRPEIATPPGVLPLRFNLSHTNGLAACAVTLDHEVGVDVEDIERAELGVDVAERYFSPTEVKRLRALPTDRQRSAFFDYWTLKESYIKARGMGLSLPLDQFTFHLEPGRPVRISFSSQLEDNPASWQFAQFTPTARHKLALAVRRPPGQDLQIVVRQTVPLARIDGV